MASPAGEVGRRPAGWLGSSTHSPATRNRAKGVNKPNRWASVTYSVASIRPARKWSMALAVAVASHSRLANDRVATAEAMPSGLSARKETAASSVMVTVAPSVHTIWSREWNSRAVGSGVPAVTSRLSAKRFVGCGDGHRPRGHIDPVGADQVVDGAGGAEGPLPHARGGQGERLAVGQRLLPVVQHLLEDVAAGEPLGEPVGHDGDGERGGDPRPPG